MSEFDATHLSQDARRAIRRNGLHTVAYFEVVNLSLISGRLIFFSDDRAFREYGGIVVIKAYSATGRKTVNVTASDIFAKGARRCQDPMARVVKRAS